MLRTIMSTSFKVKKSKVKVTRPIAAETESISYLPNRKVYTTNGGAEVAGLDIDVRIGRAEVDTAITANINGVTGQSSCHYS